MDDTTGGGQRGGRPSYWVDDATLALVKQSNDARMAWGEWLASFRWQVYGILTFTSRPSFAGAQRAVNRWLGELQQSFPRLTAYVSYDEGKGTGRLNVHVFLGGLFLHKPPPPSFHRALTITSAIAMARRAWTSGLVKKCERYDASRGAPTYLAQYCNSTDLPGEFFGRPIKKKKHRRPRHHHHTQPQ